MKLVHEVAFGIAISIYDEAAKRFKDGCRVESTASRRSLTVIFSATVAASHAATATAAAANNDAATMSAAVAKANAALSTSVPVPTPDSMSGLPAQGLPHTFPPSSSATSLPASVASSQTNGCGLTPHPHYQHCRMIQPGLALYWRFPSPRSVHFKLEHSTGHSGWLALAVATGPLMVGADAVIGQVGRGVHKYELQGKWAGAVVKQPQHDLQEASYTTSAKGSATLAFTRPLAAANGGVAITAGDTNTFLWAYGGPSLGYHHARGAVKINLATGELQVVEIDRSKFTAHAWLMGIGFGVLLPVGALFASATRGPVGILNVPNWPLIHMAIQLTGAVVFTLGAVMAYLGTEEKRSEHFKSIHQRIGLALIVVGWVQLLMALARPSKVEGEEETMLHKMWSWKHRVLGVALLVGAAANIFSGMSEYGCSDRTRLLFGLWLMVLVAAFTGVHAYKRLCAATAASVYGSENANDGAGEVGLDSLEAKFRHKGRRDMRQEAKGSIGAQRDATWRVCQLV